MSEAAEGSETGGGSTLARRWRTLWDVMLGVALCVSLLIPTLQQAGTGTLAGLRNATLLLLLNAVALVLLSRFVTRPGRDDGPRHATRRGADGLAAGPVLTPQEAGALLDDHGVPADVPGLSISDVGICVRQGADITSYANLAWADCVAVVYSRLQEPGGATFTSLQFVAVREDLIRRGTRDKRARAAAKVLGLTETAASMVWVAPPQLVHLTPLVLDHVVRQHPRVRVVRPDVVEDA